ncbi:S1C family serine protease, partial [Patescibacteria group bacterium]|nr:S1C family serine protease [Patescibacteria group bacterium]
ERPLFYQYGLDNPPVYISEQKQITIQENTAVIEAAEMVGPAMVALRTQTKAGIFLEGSGLIITSDGLMVTLAELVPQDSVSVFFVEGGKEKFQILKRDWKNNLALVKIEKSNLKTVSFANQGELKLGERVFLVGMVFDGQEPDKIVNEGIVRFFDEELIQTNIVEKHTLAGSSLFNVKGELLGLNTVDSEKIITAIPVSKIKEFAGL